MLSPARPIDHALWVFNAHANRKRFRLHGDCMAVQHGEGVACAVAQGQHHMACGQGVAQACGQVEHLQRHDALADVALLVNTTSLGMSGQPALDLSLDKLPSRALVS